MERAIKRHRRVLVLILTCILAFGSIFTVRARAEEESGYPFDFTNVLDDLESSEQFDIINYPFDYAGQHKSPGIINIVEWCYSPFKPGEFALYVYFYNPQNLNIDADSVSNRIQIATEYKTDPAQENPDTVITQNSVPTGYETFQLIFCNKSERENYEGLFYKFRVIDQKGADGRTIEERVNSIERRYDISGITLATEDGGSKEYTVGGSYRFSGYAAGYGPNEFAESTLENKGFIPLETISLTVYPTTFRTESSSLGKNHQNDLHSVYFSVPQRYFNDYGDLQKIKAEWYEYKLKPAMIFKRLSDYNEVYAKLGVNIGKHTDEITQYFVDKESYGHSNFYEYGYNVPTINENVDTVINRITTLYSAFYAEDGKVPSETVENHILSYDKTFDSGSINIGGNKVSLDLFEDTVDPGRTRGYNVKEIDANDTFDLLSYDETHSGWDRFWDYFFKAPTTDDTYKDITPIEYQIDESIMSMSDSNISKMLYISEDDVSEFKDFYGAETAKGNVPVLFRFAQTDYYNQEMYGIDPDVPVIAPDQWAWLAQETVFLDFKIIQLTFQSEGEYMVIPVVQDPVNVVPGFTPTPEGEGPLSGLWNWLKSLGGHIGAWVVLVLAVIAGIIVLSVFGRLLNLVSGAGNVFIKILLYILLFGALAVLLWFAVPWVIDIITGLGGLV